MSSAKIDQVTDSSGKRGGFWILLELGRVSILPTVWTNLAAGFLLGGGALATGQVFWLLLAGSLFYLGGMTLNDAAGVEWDRRHRPERPIPSGRIAARTVWILGFGYLAVGLLMLFALTSASVLLGSFLVATILGYTFAHKHWGGSVLLMGGVRFLLYLVGASVALDGAMPGKEVVAWGLALGIYIVGLTQTAKGEATGAPSARWARLLLFAPLIPGAIYGLRTTSLAVFPMILFTLWVALTIQMLTRGGAAQIGRAVGMLLAGMVLIDALAVAPHSTYLSLAFVLALPLLILWQRFVAAT